MDSPQSIFEAAKAAYEYNSAMRAQRARFVKFAFGEQWDDIAVAPGSPALTEAQAAIAQGRRPVTVNLLRRLVRTLVGRFRTSMDGKYSGEPGSVDSMNNLAELDARLFEEFIISGCAIQRISHERRPGGAGLWIDNVDPNRFFVNRYTDPRGHDISLIGMLHFFSWPEFLNRFGHNSNKRRRRLKAVFDASRGIVDVFGDSALCGAALPDGAPSADDRICVAEVWTLSSEPHPSRTACFRLGWKVTWFAPNAQVVCESRSPFPHGSHPFVVKKYPLVDGQTHPFIEDLIDRQKSINRLLTTFESAMATAAKGALLFPQDQLVRSLDYRTIGELWARPNAVIPIVGRGNEMPRQMYSNVNAAGIIPLVELQLKLLEESSGLTNAIKGDNVSASAGAEAFRTMVENAEAGIADILRSFSSFIDARSAKLAAFTT